MINVRDNSQSANTEAYLRDIKELLEKYYGKYAVYYDGKRVTIEEDVLVAQYYVEKNVLGKTKESVLIQHIIPLNKKEVKEVSKLKGRMVINV